MGLIIIRATLFLLVLVLLYVSQRFWFVGAWRLAGRMRHPRSRGVLRATCVVALLAVFLPFVSLAARPLGRGLLGSRAMALVGMWLSGALLAYLAVKFVRGLERLWFGWRARFARSVLRPAADGPANPSRRYFFQTATYLAGAVPFVGAVYGFAAARLRFRVGRVEVAIRNLPEALDGLRIAQLSDIHIGGYMPREQVRRAVEMADELGAELAVFTGDFITGASDPLEACVEELAALRAPLGVWGCLGNHEIYAAVEDYATELCRRVGVRILRRANAELVWRGQPFNLIGIDYEGSTHTRQRLPRLERVGPLVRRDVPNILLSHNPNAFPRAAQLGIELTLAGHTHGGQVQVEILHRHLSPALFVTEFVAGLYHRPLGLPAGPAPANGIGGSSEIAGHEPHAMACLYVNRGLGTIGAPVRLNSPPEITLLTLRCT